MRKTQKAQSKINKGTIGSLKCEVNLNKILIELNDARVTTLTMSRYYKYKSGIEALTGVDPAYWLTFMLLWKKDSLQKWEMHKDRVPKDVFSHLCTCMAAQHKIALKEHKERNVGILSI